VVEFEEDEVEEGKVDNRFNEKDVDLGGDTDEKGC